MRMSELAWETVHTAISIVAPKAGAARRGQAFAGARTMHLRPPRGGLRQWAPAATHLEVNTPAGDAFHGQIDFAFRRDFFGRPGARPYHPGNRSSPSMSGPTIETAPSRCI